jgi:hypothetical protein
MADPQTPVAQIESGNEESGTDGSSTRLNLLSIHILSLKGNDLLPNGMRIMYQKKMYTSIRI